MKQKISEENQELEKSFKKMYLTMTKMLIKSLEPKKKTKRRGLRP